jgi:hypothetical protein
VEEDGQHREEAAAAGRDDKGERTGGRAMFVRT